MGTPIQLRILRRAGLITSRRAVGGGRAHELRTEYLAPVVEGALQHAAEIQRHRLARPPESRGS